MARTPVNWDPNRYGAVRYEYQLDSATGNYALVEKEHDYNGFTYNFPPLNVTTTSPDTPIDQPVIPDMGDVQPFKPIGPKGDEFIYPSYKTDQYTGETDQLTQKAWTVEDPLVDAADAGTDWRTKTDAGKRQYWDKEGEKWGPGPKTKYEGVYSDLVSPFPDAKVDKVKMEDISAPSKSVEYANTSMEQKYGKDWKTQSLLNKRNASGLFEEEYKDFAKEPDIKKYTRSDYKLPEPKVSPFNIDEEHNKKMEIFNLTEDLRKGGLDSEEEAALRGRLDELGSYDTKTGKYKLKYKETLLDKLPIIGPARKLGRALSEAFPASPVQKLNKRIFDIRGGNRDAGRITTSQYTNAQGDVVTSSGHPATDVFAGFNRTSAFGSLEDAGQKRLNRRNKTIAKGKVSQKFIDATKEMERQHSSYVQEKRKEINKHKKEIGMPQMITSGREDQGGRDSGKIVCTMMNESYGFGSFRNKIWMKFHRDIAPEYQKGYHKLFLPLVSYAKQKGNINKIIKKTLEHIARHSTIDMRQSLRGKKHLLGRIYRKILLPLCYWIGRK